MQELIEQYAGFIKKTAQNIRREYQLFSIDTADLEQEGYIGLLKAAKRRDSAFDGIQTDNYLKLKIKTTMLTEMRKNLPLSRSYATKAKMFFEQIGDSVSEIQYQLNPEAIIDISQLLARLDKRSRFIIISRWLLGFSGSDIAKMLTVTRSWVSQLETLAFKKLKRYAAKTRLVN